MAASRRSPLVFGLLALVLSLGLVGVLLFSDDTREPEPAMTPADQSALGADSAAAPDALSAGEVSKLQPEASEQSPEVLAALARLGSELEAASTGLVSGRARRASGGALPPGLFVQATRTQPKPRIVESLALEAQELEELSSTLDEDHDEFTLEVLDDTDWLGDSEGLDHFDREQAASLSKSLATEKLSQLMRAELRDDGSFEIASFPPTGEYWLQVEHETLYVSEPALVAAGETQVELVLEEGGSLVGRLTTVDGEPAPGHTLRVFVPFDPWAMFEGNLRRVIVPETESDAQGEFRLGPVPAGYDLRLTVEAAGGLQSISHSLDAFESGEERRLDLSLPAAAHIAGRVLDLEGVPVASARVKLIPQHFDMMNADISGRGPETTDRTDEQGRFSYEDVSSGSYRLVLAAGGYRPLILDPFDIADGEMRDEFVLEADPGDRVAGRVVDQNDAPIEGASVQVAQRPSMMNMRANLDRQYRESVQTDTEGRFELYGYEADEELQAWVYAGGYEAGSEKLVAGDDDIRIVMLRSASVSGVVVSLEDAEPVTEYTLSLTPAGGLFDMTAFADMGGVMNRTQAPTRVNDPEGRFSIDGVSPGEWTLSVVADGFGRTEMEGLVLQPGVDTKGVVVWAQAEARLIGRVVDAHTGAPVPSAVVGTAGTDMSSVFTSAVSGPAPQARTDSEGRFEITGLGETKITPAVRHPEYVVRGLPALTLAPGEQRDLGEIRISHGGSLYGRVIDKRGEPVPRLTVLSANAIGSTMKRAKTDANGEWRVRGLGPDTYNVTRMDFQLDTNAESMMSMLEDLVTVSVTLAEDEERRVDLVIDKNSGTSLEGVVRSANSPASGATLVAMPERGGLQPRFTNSNERGEYVLTGLSEGPWLVQVLPGDEDTVMSTGGMPTTAVTELVEIGVGPVQRKDILLPGGELSGTVVSTADQEPLGGVRVLLERSDGQLGESRILSTMNGRTGETYTDANGSFHFKHLRSGGYDVVAGGTNAIGLGKAGWASTRLPGIEVHETRRDFSVEVELEPGGVIAGELTDTRGEALVGVPVWARHDDTGEWLSGFSEVQSDASGSFRVTGLAEGSWTLLVDGKTHALQMAASRAVRPGQETRVDLTLLPGTQLILDSTADLARAEVLLSGEMGLLPASLTSLADILSGGDRDPSKRYLPRVQPGTYGLTIILDGERVFEEALTVSSGRDQLLVQVDLEP